MTGIFFRAADWLRRRRYPANHGRIGEDLAHRYLRDHGCTVVARNYRRAAGPGEIDLIAWHGDRLVFVEVKTRETTSGIDAVQHVSNSVPTPEQQALEREKVELMKQMLRELSDRDFEVLTRTYLRDQPQAQVCAEMALTPEQLHLLKTRAKARLTELIRRKLSRKPFIRR